MPHQIALVVVPSSDNQIRMLRGILQYAAETSRIRIIKNAAIPYIPWKYLKKTKADGVIAYAESKEQIDFLKSLRLPFVNLTLHQPPAEGLAIVHSDNVEIGRRLADHLISLGLRHFAFVGHFAWYHNRLRRDGFVERLHESGFDATSVEVIFESDTQGDVVFRRIDQDQLRRQISQLPRPCGIATSHDEFAHEVVECTKQLKASVPFGISVVGVNNYGLICETTSPPLSSIAQNSERIGYLAAQLLDQLIQGQPIPTEPIVVSPGPLITRRSSEFLALDDNEVTSAIEFIRARYGQPITVTDVVEQSDVSRKTLENRFKKVLGHSIAHEIRLSRMRHAQHLLTSTSLSVIDVAVRSGFDSTSGFIRAFREYTGTTPKDYRSG